ncbi:MAG: hypothetical protein KatS3mg013_1549 [Actinomycetota bacterium]|jgi:ABC-type Fe3+ transport system permease subunit|nr:MAG: hypothetical protein KatS3mg013_1549 [Actinomycetota bacterium]
MPEPRHRTKRRDRRYQLEPQRRKRPSRSPRWYGPAVLAMIGLGVAVIVSNYIGILLPGAPSNGWLWTGFGMIAVGFVGTMYWR